MINTSFFYFFNRSLLPSALLSYALLLLASFALLTCSRTKGTARNPENHIKLQATSKCRQRVWREKQSGARVAVFSLKNRNFLQLTCACVCHQQTPLRLTFHAPRQRSACAIACLCAHVYLCFIFVHLANDTRHDSGFPCRNCGGCVCCKYLYRFVPEIVFMRLLTGFSVALCARVVLVPVRAVWVHGGPTEAGAFTITPATILSGKVIVVACVRLSE